MTHENILDVWQAKGYKKLDTELKAKRVFKPPQVNFEAEDYIDLIDWQSTTVTAVSYTHLDVYKRQVLGLCKGNKLSDSVTVRPPV